MIKTQIVSEGVFTDVGRGPLGRPRPCFPMILSWLAGGCWILLLKKDGFKASLMTRTSDTVRTHLQRCRTLGEGLLKLCAHQSPYTGRTHRLFPPPQAASVRPRFEHTATPPSRATSRGCYRYANPPPRRLADVSSLLQAGQLYVLRVLR